MKAYYYLYYTIYKAWSRSYSPLLSNSFRADVCMMALEVWLIISLYAYISIISGTKLKLSITKPIGLIPIVLALGSTLYFLTFSDRWKFYFKEFEEWPKSKNRIGSIIAWSIIVFIVANFIFSIVMMKKVVG